MALQFLNDGYFAGKVGIGVESPTRTLQVNSGGTNIVATFESSDTLSRISFVDSNTSSDAVVQIGADGNELVLFAGGAEHVRVDSAGNVGIGTTTPNGKLSFENAAETRKIVLYEVANNDFQFYGLGIEANKLVYTTPTSSADHVFFSGANATTRNELMRIEGGGNVGIGTTSPDKKLHIVDTSAGAVTYPLRLQNSGTTVGTDVGLILTTNTSGGNFASSTIRSESEDTSGNSSLVFTTPSGGSTAERMRIDSSGRVGIGTGAAALDEIFEIKSGNGSGGDPATNAPVMKITNNTTSSSWVSGNKIGSIEYWTRDPSGNAPYVTSFINSINDQSGTQVLPSGALVFGTATYNAAGGAVERMRIDSSGNVGIGTTSPERQLSLYSNNTETTPRFLIEQDGTGDAVMAFSLTGGQGWSMGIDNSGGDSFMIHNSSGGVDSSSQFTIKTDGNVGIGTTSPSYKLDVRNSGNIFIGITDLSDSTSIFRLRANGGSQELLEIKADGKVGIGTASPSSKLHIKQSADTIDGGLTWESVDGTQEWSIDANNAGNFRIYKGTTAIARFDSSGNFGIGTTSPTQKLHVAGNARVTGAYYDSNNSPGTANQVLVSTATGTDWVDGSGSGIIGGPYLPLAGGTMTGNIVMSNNIELRWKDNGGTERTVLELDSSNNLYLGKSGGGTVNIVSGTSYTTALSFDSSQAATFTGDVNIDSALLSNQDNTDVDTGTETIASVAIATYTAAFFDFVIKKGTNVRSGTVYACHDGTNVEFTETSTQDLGDTSDVTLSVDISGGNMRLRATTTSDDWSVKSLIRAI